MKIAITADLQMDMQASVGVVQPDGLTDRLNHRIDCLRWVAQEAVERGCPYLFVLGDIFDNRSAVDVGVLDAVCSAFAGIAGSFRRIVVLPGNHDSYLRNARITSLRALVGTCQVVTSSVRMELDGVTALLVPWQERVEDYTNEIGSAGMKSMDSAVLMTHALLESAVPGKGIPLSALEPCGKFRRVFLGDVHEPQDVTGDGRVQYVGAPMQYDYGDAGGRRGFVVYDTKKDKVEFVSNVVSPKFAVVKDRGTAEAANRSMATYVRVLGGAEFVGKPGVVVERIDPPPSMAPSRLGVTAASSPLAVIRSYVEAVANEADRERLVEAGVALFARGNGMEVSDVAGQGEETSQHRQAESRVEGGGETGRAVAPNRVRRRSEAGAPARRDSQSPDSRRPVR